MNARAFVIGGCLVVGACSTSLAPDPTGTAGTGDAGSMGSAGTAGSAGAAGSAGQGGTGPVTCTNNGSPSASVVDEAGSPPQMSFTVPVTVVSVTDCATGACGVAITDTRIVLSEAGGRRWTLSARFPGLPADLVEVGDALDLRVAYREDTPTPYYVSTILSRAGTAVIFDVRFAGILSDYEIFVAASPLAGPCYQDACFETWGARLTYAGETRDVAPGQTVMIGKLSFSHGQFTERPGDCPRPVPPEQMAGFTAR